MTHVAAFSDDYGSARDRFVRAASARGASLQSVPIAARAPDDTPLTIDVASLGPAQATRVVVISSGLHGVEGLFGSAVQLAWLSSRDVPPDVRIVLVHALNPFGFAWRRRANEHNVDLNRNFVTDRALLATAAHMDAQRTYDRLSPFLNPASPPPRRELYALKAASWIARVGLTALQRALPAGQYVHPRGLFYGGDDAEATTRFVRDQIALWTSGARLAVHLDLHSGLGPWGGQQWLIDDLTGSPRATWATTHLGASVRAADDRVVYRALGTMTGDLRTRVDSCEYVGVTAEFGTYSALRVLGALRAENRAHFHSAPGSSDYETAKQQLVETFVPASPAWRERAVAGALTLIDRACAASSV